MQQGLFHGPDAPFDKEAVLANVRELIARAREAGAPIFAARHIGPAGSPMAPGSPPTQLLPQLAIDTGRDRVFDKTRPSCFQGTGLAAWLDQAGIAELVICGMKTEFCVDTSCRAAAELGLRPLLVADAHTTTDSPLLCARDIIGHHNRVLGSAFAQLLQTADCRF
jgi:nicotinamidase-related amidase